MIGIASIIRKLEDCRIHAFLFISRISFLLWRDRLRRSSERNDYFRFLFGPFWNFERRRYHSWKSANKIGAESISLLERFGSKWWGANCNNYGTLYYGGKLFTDGVDCSIRDGNHRLNDLLTSYFLVCAVCGFSLCLFPHSYLKLLLSE